MSYLEQNNKEYLDLRHIRLGCIHHTLHSKACHIFKSTKGYGICMDPMDQSEPIMVKGWQKKGVVKSRESQALSTDKKLLLFLILSSL